MTVDIYDSEPFQLMEKVADLSMEGKSELAIARALGIKRTEVVNHLRQWHALLANDKFAKDAARDRLNQMVEHYDRLIAKLYDLYNDLQLLPTNHQNASQINTTLKNIADFEKTRVDLLQKAGLLEGEELGNELADMERKQGLLIDILRNELCERCTPLVRRRLSEVTGKVEVIQVHPE
jgi:hypothetical protein